MCLVLLAVLPLAARADWTGSGYFVVPIRSGAENLDVAPLHAANRGGDRTLSTEHEHDTGPDRPRGTSHIARARRTVFDGTYGSVLTPDGADATADGAWIVRVDGGAAEARHDSAEHFSRSGALLFTAMAWIFIPAYCFAVP